MSTKLLRRSGLFLLIGIAVLSLYWSLDDSRLPRARSPAELMALSDDAIDTQMLMDLSRRLHGAQQDPSAWKSFREPARNLWVTTVVTQAVLMGGFQAVPEATANEPGLVDAKEAFEAMGLTEAADIIKKALRKRSSPANPPGSMGSPHDLEDQFKAALESTEARKRRIAYLRQNVTDIANPQ